MARILVIEDEDNIRTTVKLALISAGHTVTTASNGMEGVRFFGDGTGTDVVLLDQRMPDMRGIEVLGRLRARDSDAWVIMMTAMGTSELVQEATRAGASDFLRKPFTVEVLRGAVATAMEGKRPIHALARAESGTTFGSMTLNGFRIESHEAPSPAKPGVLGQVVEAAGRLLHRSEAAQSSGEDDFQHMFLVRSPDGEVREVTVLLPANIVAEVRSHGTPSLPGGESRFFTLLGEEALANYLWQRAAFPSESLLRVDEFGPSLRRWAEAARGSTSSGDKR